MSFKELKTQKTTGSVLQNSQPAGLTPHIGSCSIGALETPFHPEAVDWTASECLYMQSDLSPRHLVWLASQNRGRFLKTTVPYFHHHMNKKGMWAWTWVSVHFFFNRKETLISCTPLRISLKSCTYWPLDKILCPQAHLSPGEQTETRKHSLTRSLSFQSTAPWLIYDF